MWTAERLFQRFFLPLYPHGPDGELARARTTDANPAGNPRILAQLDAIAEAFAALAPARLDAPELALDFSDASVHRLGAALTRARRDALIAPVAAVGEVPPLVEVVTHGAVYVGACIVKNHGGRWQVRSPLWESLVELASRAGTGKLALFQWWLKALSDEEVDDARLGSRYRLHVEIPTARPEELPLIARDRKIPRLTKVRYDSLHRHLKAHLPELRDVGASFPSPERFAELDFQWLDFLLLGGGRMLLMHGPASTGAHLFWLDASGFAGAAYFPADALTDHEVSVSGDTLAIALRVLGRQVRHELLWWGPGPSAVPS